MSHLPSMLKRVFFGTWYMTCSPNSTFFVDFMTVESAVRSKTVGADMVFVDQVRDMLHQPGKHRMIDGNVLSSAVLQRQEPCAEDILEELNAPFNVAIGW